MTKIQNDLVFLLTMEALEDIIKLQVLLVVQLHVIVEQALSGDRVARLILDFFFKFLQEVFLSEKCLP